MTDTGRLTGSRERSQSPLSSPVGFDPGRFEELAERCEKAAGPDRLADQAIGWIVGTQRWRGSSVTEYDGPAYTASLDAAMALVDEPEKGVSVWRTPRDGGLCCATVYHGEVAEARTMALALCAAALRALTPPSEPTEK